MNPFQDGFGYEEPFRQAQIPALQDLGYIEQN